MTYPAKEPQLPQPLAQRWQALLQDLASLDSLMVAFSGGVDSSLLLAAARRALGDRVQAGLCLGPFTPPWEAERARDLARDLGVVLHELDACELDDPLIVRNDPQRCYYCKRLRLGRLKEFARGLGLAAVAEGSQIDDAQDFRPGHRAVQEHGILSPLAKAGLNKADVRAISRALGLPTAELPPAACFASRVPWGTALNAENLDRVGRAEAALRGLLGGQFRVRDHHPLARLELPPAELARAASEPLRSRLVQAVKDAGYAYVVLDLEGYRAGGGQEAPREEAG